MELSTLKEKLKIHKVPTHPNKSSFKEWLDIYEFCAQTSPQFFPEGMKGDILSLMKESLSEQNFDDKKYYVLKMFFRDLDEVIVRRRSVKNKRKNSVLSRMAQKRWRRHRHKYQRALKKFHKSSKGKDFHKSLGRFLRRSVSQKENYTPMADLDNQGILDLMLAINSGLTHFLIEYQINLTSEEPLEDFDEELLDMVLEMTNQMLLDLKFSLTLPEEKRFDIVHDVLFLAGEVLIPTGIETQYSYKEE